MSLIEEALRKQREETEKARGELTIKAPAPAEPPPLPETVEPPVEEAVPVRKALPALIVSVAGGILLVAGIVWLLLYGINLRSGGESKPAPAAKPADKAAKVDRPMAGAMAAASTSAAPAAASTTVVIKVQTPAPVAPAAVAPVAASATVVAVDAPVTVTGKVMTGGQADVVHVDGGAAAAPVPAVQKIAVVVWPKLTVTGIIGATRGGKSAAIVNGQMVTPGAVVEGVKIEAIDRLGVKLSFEGESRTLSVGGSTE